MAKTDRPKTKIDLDQAEKLGMLQCTYKECSAWLGIAESTLKSHKEFSAAFKKGKEKGKLSLRRSQFKLAEKNAGMAIWLGKQYLEQKDPDKDSNEIRSHQTETIDFEYEEVKS